MQIISIQSSSGAYPVVCGRHAFRQLGRLLGRIRSSSGAYVLSSPKVWKHLGSAIERLVGRGMCGEPILFGDAERRKNLETVQDICRQLARAGADRDCVLVAVGGGVVGDVAGYAAASYLRGVKIVHVPTTLVAQVDSSIGGKTGVNLPEGKNLIGAFYPPQFVVADSAALRSLPDREYRSGLYEVIKYGIIGDAALFAFVERKMAQLLRRDAKAVARVVERCIRAKAAIVAKDERESGLRQVLNLGHTLGHAFETAGNYRRFQHGEAVGWGLMGAALLSYSTNRMGYADVDRIARVVMSVGDLPKLPGLRAPQILRLIHGDKKARHGRVGWVLPRRIGKVEWGIPLPDAVVSRVIRELPDVARLARGQA
ncbi:MAG: 3-dehydroquinate synthase [Candidatus Acidiferrales bacterium]